MSRRVKRRISSRSAARSGLGRGAAFRLLPVTDAEVDELIDSAEGVATELDGFRGSPLLGLVTAEAER